jgi:hypothetical protein
VTTHGFTKLRRGSQSTFELTVPTHISRVLLDAGMLGHLFAAELTEEGLLFCPVDGPMDATVPKWVTS